MTQSKCKVDNYIHFSTLSKKNVICRENKEWPLYVRELKNKTLITPVVVFCSGDGMQI